MENAGFALAQVQNLLAQLVQAINANTVAINTKFPDWVAVPANSAATGTAGQVAYAAGFFYVCVATDHWQRVAIVDF